MKSNRRWILPVGSVVTILLAAALGYLVLSAAWVFGNDQGTTAKVSLTANLLQTSNRDKLAICVEAHSKGDQSAAVLLALEPKAKQVVEATFSHLAAHKAWADQGLSNPPPEVNIGCPSEPSAFSEDLPSDSQTPFGAIGFAVDQPSEYKVHVYLVEDEVIEGWGGDDAFRLGVQEKFCLGDSCRQVTTALYLRERDLDNDAFMAFELEKAIGLEPWW